VKCKITIDLTIDLNGVSKEDIDWRLNKAVQFLFAEGLLTGDTAAEIDEYDYKVEEI